MGLPDISRVTWPICSVCCEFNSWSVFGPYSPRQELAIVNWSRNQTGFVHICHEYQMTYSDCNILHCFQNRWLKMVSILRYFTDRIIIAVTASGASLPKEMSNQFVFNYPASTLKRDVSGYDETGSRSWLCSILNKVRPAPVSKIELLLVNG